MAAWTQLLEPFFAHGVTTPSGKTSLLLSLRNVKARKPTTRITGEDVERWRQELATMTHRRGQSSIEELPGNK